MTTNRVRKALDRITSGDDPLDILAAHGALTSAGAAWVKCALDPFHDYEVTDLDGIPDVETEPTLVVRTQQSVVVSNPGGGTWDCNIVNMPVDFSFSTEEDLHTDYGSYRPVSNIGGPMPGSFEIAKGTIPRMDGLQISVVPTGDNTYNGTEPRQNLGLDDYLITGSGTDLMAYRVVSSGFEVVNSTASLQRSGACTVYEIGEPGEYSDFRSSYKDESGDYARVGTVRNFRMPPISLAEAKQTPGARTWHAEEGCYVVSKHRSEMGFSPVAKRDFVYASSSKANPSWATHLAGCAVGTESVPVPPVEKNGCASHISNLNLSGAYFTGLSEETTLQVTWRVVLERLPGPFDLQNLALASPSAPYDPRALELYSHITAKLPPGVPVGYNDAGKYFKMIAYQIKSAVKQTLPLLPAIEAAMAASGFPVAAAAVEGARVGAQVAHNKQLEKKNKKKPSIPNHGKP